LMVIIVCDPGQQQRQREQGQPLEKLEWTDWHRNGRKQEDTIESWEWEIACRSIGRRDPRGIWFNSGTNNAV